MKETNKKFYIFSFNVEPNGISGGETILIETFKRINKYFKKVTVYTWKPGKDLYLKYGLNNVFYKVSHIPVVSSFYISLFLRTFYGLWLGLSTILPDPENSYLYFSSDFWPDALAVIFIKLRYPSAIFVSNFYLTAPNPFIGFNEKGGFKVPNINGIFFYVMQKPVYWFSRKFADIVFVTSKPDVDRFPTQKMLERYFVVKGGVNVAEIEKFKKSHKTKKIYDGVFMGRFHPQKGVLELIDIWRFVVAQRKSAQLIMIGDGKLMKDVKRKIEKHHLEKNITLTGYVFSDIERFSIFQKSKIALHPALYDSGGMAVAEAMAFGLPAVSFDLLALKTYYPKGMLKVSQGNKKLFAAKILSLLEDKKLYNATAREAMQLVHEEWDWDKRARTIAQKLLTLKNNV